MRLVHLLTFNVLVLKIVKNLSSKIICHGKNFFKQIELFKTNKNVFFFLEF